MQFSSGKEINSIILTTASEIKDGDLSSENAEIKISKIGNKSSISISPNESDNIEISNKQTEDRITFDSLSFNYKTTIPSYSYSDFTDMQLQFKYEFDFTEATDVEETGIFVTDDNKFSFDSGEYDDNEYTFEEFITPGTNYHKFINKNKKAPYIAGINLDPSQYNLDFYAAAYVKVDGKYYFSKNTQSSVQDLVLEYSYSTSLTEEQKAIIDALMSTIE